MVTLKHNPPPLQACQYRRLWLDDAHALGMVAEILADALDWQPTTDQPLPDALTLAQIAAERIVELKAQCVLGKITRQPITSDSKHVALSYN